MIDLEYTEIDGLLYPDIDTGYKWLSTLDKYGKMRLNYLHGQKPEMYRELLFTGKLAEHCEQIEVLAFKCRSSCRRTISLTIRYRRTISVCVSASA